jgi:energy-converting hydrogenase Eha subunit E
VSVEIFSVAAAHALAPVAVGISSGNKRTVVIVGVLAAIVGGVFGDPVYAALDVGAALVGLGAGLWFASKD